jgi:hypothetical protein
MFPISLILDGAQMTQIDADCLSGSGDRPELRESGKSVLSAYYCADLLCADLLVEKGKIGGRPPSGIFNLCGGALKVRLTF